MVAGKRTQVGYLRAYSKLEETGDTQKQFAETWETVTYLAETLRKRR